MLSTNEITNQEKELIKWSYLSLVPFIFFLIVLSSNLSTDFILALKDLKDTTKLIEVLSGLIAVLLNFIMIYYLVQQNKIAKREIRSIESQMILNEKQLILNMKSQELASRREVSLGLMKNFQEEINRIEIIDLGNPNFILKGSFAINECLIKINHYVNETAPKKFDSISFSSFAFIKIFQKHHDFFNFVFKGDDEMLKCLVVNEFHLYIEASRILIATIITADRQKLERNPNFLSFKDQVTSFEADLKEKLSTYQGVDFERYLNFTNLNIVLNQA